jgi:hypothetical protein
MHLFGTQTIQTIYMPSNLTVPHHDYTLPQCSLYYEIKRQKCVALLRILRLRLEVDSQRRCRSSVSVPVPVPNASSERKLTSLLNTPGRLDSSHHDAMAGEDGCGVPWAGGELYVPGRSSPGEQMLFLVNFESFRKWSFAPGASPCLSSTHFHTPKSTLHSPLQYSTKHTVTFCTHNARPPSTPSPHHPAPTPH